MLATPVVLEDRDFNLVVFAAHADEVDPVRQRTILAAAPPPQVQDWFEAFGIAQQRPAGPDACRPRARHRRPRVPARPLERRHLRLPLGARRAPPPRRRRLLERVMQQAVRAGTVMAQRARTRQSLDGQVRDLLTGDRDVAEAAAEEIDGLGALGPGRARCARGARPRRSSGPAAAQPLAAAPGGRRGRHRRGRGPARPGRHGRPRRRPRRPAALHRTPGACAARRRGRGGRRRPAGPRRISGSVREARLAARVAHAVPRFRPVAAWADLGVHRLLACGPRRALREGAVDAAVEPLLARPDLAATAAALPRPRRQRRSAPRRSWAIHRQTLYYRLQPHRGARPASTWPTAGTACGCTSPSRWRRSCRDRPLPHGSGLSTGVSRRSEPGRMAERAVGASTCSFFPSCRTRSIPSPGNACNGGAAVLDVLHDMLFRSHSGGVR